MEKSEKKFPMPYWRKNSSLNFSIGLILSLTMVITAFEWNFKSTITDKPIDSITIVDIDKSDMIEVRVPSPPKTIVPPNPEDIIEKKEEPVKKEDPLKDLPPVFTNEGDGEPNFDDILPSDLAPGKEKTDKPEYELISAKPIGGFDAFYAYLYKNIHYPDHLLNRNKIGKVSVKFQVDEKGNITNIQIEEGFDKMLEKEIIRVLRESPAWIPAQKGAKKVKTTLTIPFSFDLR